jgi:hypothetical protein
LGATSIISTHRSIDLAGVEISVPSGYLSLGQKGDAQASTSKIHFEISAFPDYSKSAA